MVCLSLSFTNFIWSILEHFVPYVHQIITLCVQALKVVRIRSYSGPHFHAFGQNIIRISLYSVQMRENPDQNNAKYEHFSCSAKSKCKNKNRNSRLEFSWSSMFCKFRKILKMTTRSESAFTKYAGVELL